MDSSYHNLFALMAAFPDEAACVQHLERMRWPRGIICPLCGGSRKFYQRRKRPTHECADCEREFSVRKGTIFEESRLPLRKWFMLCRTREVAAQMNGQGGPTSGAVEVDETFVGSKDHNKHQSKCLKQGRGTVGKTAAMGAKDRGGKVKVQVVEGTRKADLQPFIQANVTPRYTAYADEHGAYHGLSGYVHDSVVHSPGTRLTYARLID